MGVLPWSCVALTLMRFYPTAHALSVLWTHRYYTHVVAPTHSPTPISPFTSFSCSLAHTAPHPPYTNSLKDSLFTHSYKYKSQPSLLLLSLLATLPLGSMSWSGLKELAPCTWSALFTGHACEWGGLFRAAFLRAHRANLRSGQVEPTFCLFSSRRRHIWANLFWALLFFFSVLTFLFFWWATPSHRLVAAFVCFTFCIKSSFLLFTLWKKWRGPRHWIPEDNPATLQKNHPHNLSLRIQLIFCVDWGTMC